MIKDCKYIVEHRDDHLQTNALRCEVIRPMARCILKVPEHWPKAAKERGGASWILSGGSALVFGYCDSDCPEKDNMTMSPKQAREFLGLNQTEMAEAMGMHRNLWLKIERGEQGLTAAPSRLLETLLWLKSENLIDKYFTFFSE